MANLSKMRRDRLIAYIEQLKQEHTDDESIMLFNEIENALTEKRYGLVFEEHTEYVDDMLVENVPVLTADPTRRLCKDATLPWNFIIEGDNLQALYLLEKTHKGKLDCIYIDPPYNTGAKDWKYNNDYVGREDDYRHSKWLSMLKSRLTIAKRLLNPKDSVLIVTIDEKEYLRLGCLLEEMFPDANMQMISSVISFKGSARKRQFTRLDEYIFILEFGEAAVQRLPLSDEWRINPDDMRATHLTWKYLIRSGSAGLRERSPGNFYPVFFTADGKYHSIGEALPATMDRHEIIPPEGTFAVFPIDTQGREHYWNIGPDKFLDYKKKGYIKFGRPTKNGVPITFLTSGEIKKVEQGVYEIDGYDENGAIISKNEVRDIMPGTQWRITTHDATRHGTDLLTKFLPGRQFPYPKSLYAVHDVINFFVAHKPNAVILDFFAGSGTTLHAVNLLNAEDGGNRRCIMVTNNEVSAEEAKILAKNGYKPGDDEWEALGIAKYVTWPRTVCSITGLDTEGNPIKGDYLANSPDGSTIAMMEGFTSNAKYFKCSWVPRISENSLAEQLMQHMKEMIELEHAIEVDNKRILVVLTEEDADYIEQHWNEYTELECIYISKNVLLTTKQNLLFSSVEKYTIPDYYFDIELKEVGESW